MSRFWKITLIVVAVVVLALVGFRLLHKPAGTASSQTAAKGKDGKDATPPVPVTVVPVVKQNVPVYLTALGTVQALNTVTVNPQVAGQLMSINFTEGGPVKKGQVLAQIDPRTFQASYDQAVSKRNQDQSLLATAHSNYQRSQDPKYSPYVAKVNLDTLKNTVTQYQAAVAADDAAIRDAKVQLDYTQIRSPIDGLAGIRAVDPGNVVSTSTSIVTLTQLHPINVMFTLPEQNLDMVRRAAQGDLPLQVTALDRVDAHPIASGGVLKVIDNQIDTTTGTFRLKSEFSNEQNTLWPGQFVNVQLLVSTVDGGLVIPSQAVQRGPGRRLRVSGAGRRHGQDAGDRGRRRSGRQPRDGRQRSQGGRQRGDRRPVPAQAGQQGQAAQARRSAGGADRGGAGKSQEGRTEGRWPPRSRLIVGATARMPVRIAPPS